MNWRIPEETETAPDHGAFAAGTPGKSEARGDGASKRVEPAVRAAGIAGAEITQRSIGIARGSHARLEALHPSQVIMEGKHRIPAQPEIQVEVGGGAEIILTKKAPARSRERDLNPPPPCQNW